MLKRVTKYCITETVIQNRELARVNERQAEQAQKILRLVRRVFVEPDST